MSKYPSLTLLPSLSVDVQLVDVVVEPDSSSVVSLKSLQGLVLVLELRDIVELQLQVHLVLVSSMS